MQVSLEVPDGDRDVIFQHPLNISPTTFLNYTSILLRRFDTRIHIPYLQEVRSQAEATAYKYDVRQAIKRIT